MTSGVRAITFDGPPGPVFDLVTAARFWPRWFPTTRAVAGVIERPYQLGDLIREDLESNGVRTQVLWRVADHVRPSRVVLQSETPALRITYAFRRLGRGTELRRELEYQPADFAKFSADPEQLECYIRGQADLALKRLQELVEGILRQEAADVGKVRATRPPLVGAGRRPGEPADSADPAAAVGAAGEARQPTHDG